MTIQIKKSGAGYDLFVCDLEDATKTQVVNIAMTRAAAIQLAGELAPTGTKDYMVKKMSERLNRTRGHEAMVTV